MKYANDNKAADVKSMLISNDEYIALGEIGIHTCHDLNFGKRLAG